MKKIVVLGSINMDLVSFCTQAPRGGETLFGNEFQQISGGKGANQAVAIAKLGGNITMLGKVGSDSMGASLLTTLAESGVDISHIEKVEKPNISTGIANITVEANGQNRILVIAGANAEVDIDYINRHLDVIKNADILVTQLEIPLESVEYALVQAKLLGKTTLLNPAPAQALNSNILANTDYLIPNETELEILSKINTDSLDGIKQAAHALLAEKVQHLIITLGSKGALYIDRQSQFTIPAHKVQALDTTAAGDSFIGGLSLGLAQNLPFKAAMEMASAVAAISVTRKGAQTSLPSKLELDQFLENLK